MKLYRRLLITGFEPFGGETVNPSWQAVEALPEQIGEWNLTKSEAPVEYGLAAQHVLELAETMHPDAILCVGQAAGRTAVTPEYVAINLRCAAIPDNAGYFAEEEPVDAGGPDALFSTLPVRRMASAIQAAGLAGAVSFSAGTYVCNDLLYLLLLHYAGTRVRVGFVHVPLLPEQAKERPSMPLEQICGALTAAIHAI